MARKKEQTMTAVTDQEQTEQTTEETQEVPTHADQVIIDGVNVNDMTPEQILAKLAARKAEIAAVTKVAKERGVVVPKEKKVKTADAENLDRLFNRLGYSTGMRRWADGRMDDNGTRIQAAIGDILSDPERLDELVTALAEGYREAKIQSSFNSEVMKDKATAKVTAVADILPEVLGRLGDKDWDFLVAVRQA